jgi:hypothetical protein
MFFFCRKVRLFLIIITCSFVRKPQRKYKFTEERKNKYTCFWSGRNELEAECTIVRRNAQLLIDIVWTSVSNLIPAGRKILNTWRKFYVLPCVNYARHCSDFREKAFARSLCRETISTYVVPNGQKNIRNMGNILFTPLGITWLHKTHTC